METFAAIGGALFVLMSLFVGLRVLWLAKRTRGAVELALGGGLVLMGGIGYPLVVIAMRAEGLALSTREALFVGHMVATTLGMSGLAWFTQHVFRPTAAWALGLFAFIALGHVAIGVVQAAGPGLAAFLQQAGEGPWANNGLLSILTLTWSGSEALRYWVMQRKRLRLGLADPVVADRIRLWAGAILTSAVISIVGQVMRALGIDVVASTASQLMVGPLGTLSALLLFLAFFPPKAYVAWVARRDLAFRAGEGL